MKKEFFTHSAKETAELGCRLGSLIREKCLIAFKGDLGAGKTCFTTGLVRGIDYSGEVNSPTFAIINEYFGGRLPVYHFDMYRISGEDELYSIGFFDYLEENAVMVVEWSENITEELPDDCVFITIEHMGEQKRKIVIESSDEKNFLKEL